MPVDPHPGFWERLGLHRRFVAIAASITASILVSALTTSTASAAAPYPGPGDPSTRVSISLSSPMTTPAPSAKGSAAGSSYIVCYADAYQPVLATTWVYADAHTSCNAVPDLFSAVLTIWAYYDGTYHKTGTLTDTTPPNLEYSMYAPGEKCGHGWIYHTEFEIAGFHGNWDHAIANSPAVPLC